VAERMPDRFPTIVLASSPVKAVISTGGGGITGFSLTGFAGGRGSVC